MTRTISRPRPQKLRGGGRPVGATDEVAGAAPTWGWSAAVALAALALYLSRLPPVSGEGDSSEFTLVLALNGVAHPTGYPLYTLLGHGFVSLVHALGVGWARAAAAWSALGGAVAVGLLHALAARLVPPELPTGSRTRGLLALLPAAFFLANPVWMCNTIVAEVYSWHLVVVCALALLFLTALRRVLDEPTPSRRSLRILAALWGLGCGVGLAHHLTIVWVAAPLSLVLLGALLAARRMRAELVPLALGAALVPLASYLLLLARAGHPGPAVWPGIEGSWAKLVEHVTAQQYHYELGDFAPSTAQRRELMSDVVPFLVAGFAVHLLGVLERPLAGRERLARAALGTALLASVGFAFRYGVVDPAPYFLSPLALALAPLALLLARLVAGSTRARRLGLATTGALGLLWLALLPRGLDALREQRREAVSADALVHALWAGIPSDSGLVFWPSDTIYRLLGYQWLGGERRGLEPCNPGSLTYGPARRVFMRRHGFDPYGGVRHLRDRRDPRALLEFYVDLYDHVNRRTRLPVMVFDPRDGRVHVLAKPPAAP